MFKSRAQPKRNKFNPDSYSSVITDSLTVFETESVDEFKERFEPRDYKLIGTHSGAFHCDEVLATTMLLWTNEFQNSAIVRTRNTEILDQMDILCDVGGVFNHEKRRFDHH